METQNVTLALPKDLLRKAKRIAHNRQTSLSALLGAYMKEITDQEDRYEASKREALALMEAGFNWGAASAQPWTRDELHERRD